MSVRRAWSIWAPAAACTATWQRVTSWWRARRTSRSPTLASPSCCRWTKTITLSASQARAPFSGGDLVPAQDLLPTALAPPRLRPSSQSTGSAPLLTLICPSALALPHSCGCSLNPALAQLLPTTLASPTLPTVLALALLLAIPGPP